MENKKENGDVRTILFVLGGLVLFVLIGLVLKNYSQKEDIYSNIPPYSQANNTSTTNGEISVTDQKRINDILTGVMQDELSVTNELKTEIKGIFKKYGTTEEELRDFIFYGAPFAAYYQTLFFNDALKSLSLGYAIKSTERLEVEQKGLSKGLMTSERIKINDEEMGLIAKRLPVTRSNGQSVVFTEELIKSTLQNINSVTDRLSELLK